MMQTANIITLTTDFGLEDPFVGQLKGILLTVNRRAHIIDLCHALPAHDILSAALTVQTSYRYFPEGSLHLVVVDPGVGSSRHILAATADKHLFITPDNGLLPLILKNSDVGTVYRVENATLFSRNISSTFHGRDIMAPVAAELARGMALDRVGPVTTLDCCVHLDLPEPTISSSTIEGRVIQIDHFGNIRTNISRADLNHFPPSAFTEVRIKGQQITTFAKTYADAPSNNLLTVIDSADYLEIAVNRGNAAQCLNAGIGDRVTVVMRGKR
ncbi:MAG: hypothetical protein DSY80_00720 [Desulfocapsa sp.]|nr:MAG: hypothetical protein DSY80_00720 [Desulfocapsa sp.]